MIESIKQVWRMPWHFACAGKEASSVSGQRHLCLNSECQCFATVVVALTFIVVILVNCYSYCDGGIAIGILLLLLLDLLPLLQRARVGVGGRRS